MQHLICFFLVIYASYFDEDLELNEMIKMFLQKFPLAIYVSVYGLIIVSLDRQLHRSIFSYISKSIE
jgi:hypothetical protein